MAERSRPGCRLVFLAVLALLPLLALAQPDGRPEVTFGSLLDPSERVGVSKWGTWCILVYLQAW